LEIRSCFLSGLAWTMNFLSYTACHIWDDRCISWSSAIG
jgi:hypothetical protein